LHFAGAHRPAWLISPGEFHLLRGSRYPIGGLRLEENRNYPQTTIQYTPGDMLYLFSDGIVDQFSSHTGKKFTAGRLRKLLDQICTLEMRRQKDMVHETMLLWKGAEPQTDDMMLLGLRLQ
jgi:serine phosphatase RsbU (regulator of sigma subunit)